MIYNYKIIEKTTLDNISVYYIKKTVITKNSNFFLKLFSFFDIKDEYFLIKDIITNVFSFSSERLYYSGYEFDNYEDTLKKLVEVRDIEDANIKKHSILHQKTIYNEIINY